MLRLLSTKWSRRDLRSAAHGDLQVLAYPTSQFFTVASWSNTYTDIIL